MRARHRRRAVHRQHAPAPRGELGLGLGFGFGFGIGIGIGIGIGLGIGFGLGFGLGLGLELGLATWAETGRVLGARRAAGEDEEDMGRDSSSLECILACSEP